MNTFQLLTLQIMSKNSTSSRARFFFYLSASDNNHFTCQLYFLLRLSSSHMDAIFSNVLPFFLLFESNYQNLLIDWKRRGIIKTMKHNIALPVMSYHWSMIIMHARMAKLISIDVAKKFAVLPKAMRLKSWSKCSVEKTEILASKIS